MKSFEFSSRPPPYDNSDSSEQPLADRIIGRRYRVIEELGRGGMGAVYRVLDENLGSEVALKQLLLPKRGGPADSSVSLFEREFFVLAQLAHPRVIAVYDYGVDPEGPFYTMELLDGGDLRRLSPLPVELACAFAVEICSSLALLHARQLVHRDISPNNVRCTRDGHAKLIDFGAMVPMGPCSKIVGTPAFVAPEVVSRSTLDGRTDLFSLGGTLYFALTGQAPFGARHFAELRTAWGFDPIPPSQLAPGIPPALDALCASLLCIDPAQRPRTAFEVIQRLQAIAGVHVDESVDVREAYLVAPALVGREHASSSFRQQMRQALLGRGGALIIESRAGLGRSRALDACVLDAKTMGASVLRATATGNIKPFGLAQLLLEQLLQTLGEAALKAAKDSQQWDVLFEPSSDPAPREATLRVLSDPGLDHATIHAAIAAWIACTCKVCPLMIAVDDVQRADEASLALLAALTLEAREARLLVHVTIDSDERDRRSPALRVLLEHASIVELSPLTRAQSEELLSRVFGDVPHLTMLAERFFQVALGNPAEIMELARHLVRTGVVRYEKGQWKVPSRLEQEQLPASAADVLAARIAALPALARSLAEAQALVGSALRRDDYVLLAPHVSKVEIDTAISTLLEREIIQNDGQYYRLSHRALAEALTAMLDPEQRAERHSALYEFYCQQSDKHPFFGAHHLLEAGRVDEALDLLATLHKAGLDLREDEAVLERAEPARLASMLEHALELAVARGRPARELNALRGRLLGLCHRVDDNGLYARIAPVWLAQLEHDSGLDDYRALDPNLPQAARLQQALIAAATRFDSTPEHARVYSVQDAIKLLVLYVAMSIVPVTRWADFRVAAKLPMLLEPFVTLSPVVFAVQQNVTALCEYFGGRRLKARARWSRAYELLGDVVSDAMPWIAAMRDAVAQGVAKCEASIGNRAGAMAWFEKLETKAMHRVGAMYELRLASLMNGDPSGAESVTKQAELLALRNCPKQMFDPTWPLELPAWVLLRDLTGIGHVVDAMRALAARYSGWHSQLKAAEGWFDFVRGDLGAARAAFETALSEARPEPDRPPWAVFAWTDAVSGLIGVLTALAEYARAVELGERALADCAANAFDFSVTPISQGLAIAEAQLGRATVAMARIEALIAMQKGYGMHGLLLAKSYMIAVRIALIAGDSAAANRFAALAAEEPGGQKLLAFALRHEPVFADARRGGLELALTPSVFEVSAIGTTSPGRTGSVAMTVREKLASCRDSHSRAQRALELLCEQVEGSHAELYLVDVDRTLKLVATTNAATPDALALALARSHFAQEIDADDANTVTPTEAAQHLARGAASYPDQYGDDCRYLTLKCRDHSELVYVGLAVVRAKLAPECTAELPTFLTALATCLLADSSSVRM